MIFDPRPPEGEFLDYVLMIAFCLIWFLKMFNLYVGGNGNINERCQQVA